MKNWSLEKEKYYNEWSELIKKYSNMGYDNDNAQLKATKEMEKKYDI